MSSKVRMTKKARSMYTGVKSDLKRNVAAYRIQSAWRRRTKPSRLYSGRATYNQTRKITNAVMANISESKYAGVRKDCIDVVAKPFGTIRPMSYIFLNTGSNIASVQSEYNGGNLDLFKFDKGFSGDNRVGEYMYVKHTTLKLEVQCPPVLGNPDTDPNAFSNGPIRCRLMIVKANRKNNKYGNSPVPKNSLFIDTQNGQFGYGETSGSINLLMKQPINKRKWLVYKDTSFTLNPPSIMDYASGNNLPIYSPGHGRSTYRCNVKLPVYKKVHFDESTAIPDDLDTQWFVILQACYENHCLQTGVTQLRPTNLHMEVLGTTTALDN